MIHSIFRFDELTNENSFCLQHQLSSRTKHTADFHAAAVLPTTASRVEKTYFSVILAGGRLKVMLPRPHRSRTFRPVPLSIMCCLVAVLLLNGCGMGSKNPPPMAPSGFAFVSNSGSGSVSAMAMDSSGALSLVAGSPFSAGAGAEFLAFDSLHKFLFVSNQNANTVSAFSVDTGTGQLSAVPGSPFATG